MIKRFIFRNFKGFSEFSVSFDRINLLIGGNNSGKTSVFHALQTFFWCLEKTASINGNKVKLAKTQLPEIGAIPYFNIRDLFYKQKTRTGRSPTRIVFELEATKLPLISFEIYPAFSRNVIVTGKDVVLTNEQYKRILDLKPIFIPSTVGITVQEELYREIALERLVTEGRHNQVHRNMIYRLRQKNLLEDFRNIMQPLFGLTDVTVPFDENNDEWLTAIYEEDGCSFDFLSAGSGFLQVSNIIAFLLLHPAKVALLDEPDSHMHDDLQRLIFDVLRKLVENKKSQLLITTHSSTLIDAAGIEALLIIDKDEKEPLRPRNIENLIPLLSDRGLSLPPRKVMNTLMGRKVLFVEGREADYEKFVKIIGSKLFKEFANCVRRLTVFESEGATKKWPFDTIKTFEDLLGVKIQYMYLGDRDFSTDDEVKEKIEKTADKDRHLIHYLKRRNRESYLLEPALISRMAISKWRQKKKKGSLPNGLKVEYIKKDILEMARNWESETQVKFQLQHEPRGNTEEKAKKLTEVNRFFKENYSDLLNKNIIPYKILDSKKGLAELRTKIVDRHGISFSDTDILDEMSVDEIPEDIKNIISALFDLLKN